MQIPVHDRDFRGSRGGASFAHWPVGHGLAVSLVANIEEGTELSIGMSDEANESVYEAVQRVGGHRDLCILAHAVKAPGVWFARRNEIGHAWRAANGLAPWTPPGSL